MKLLLLGLFLAFAACTGNGTEFQGTILRCDGCPTARVVRIIDGDTLDTSRGRIRLFGVDTPEVGQPCASEATKRLRDLAGDTIRIEVGPRTADQYGRMLAYAYTEDGISIDEALIREGLAGAWMRDGQHQDYLVGLEREAREQEVGCLGAFDSN